LLTLLQGFLEQLLSTLLGDPCRLLLLLHVLLKEPLDLGLAHKARCSDQAPVGAYLEVLDLDHSGDDGGVA